MKNKKERKIKIWIYLWPQDKKIKDGQIMFKRILASTHLKLKEIEAEIIYKP